MSFALYVLVFIDFEIKIFYCEKAYFNSVTKYSSNEMSS